MILAILFTNFTIKKIILFLLDGLKLTTKISAQVKFQNLAGKDITITAKPAIESIAKEIELRPGSRATLKIDESSMDEPVIFSAKWTGETKELWLNENVTVEVKPRPEANYTVEITVTDPGKRAYYLPSLI